MTKFADPKFSVAAPLTEAYAAGYARAFPATVSDKHCTECYGTGRSPDSDHRTECVACSGTGLRRWQMPAPIS